MKEIIEIKARIYELRKKDLLSIDIAYYLLYGRHLSKDYYQKGQTKLKLKGV